MKLAEVSLSHSNQKICDKHPPIRMHYTLAVANGMWSLGICNRVCFKFNLKLKFKRESSIRPLKFARNMRIVTVSALKLERILSNNSVNLIVLSMMPFNFWFQDYTFDKMAFERPRINHTSCKTE